MKLKSKSALVLTTLLASMAAMAQTKAPEPDYTLSYNVGVTSDYRFRGISQTSFKPALQAGVDFAHKSGFYLGAWGSNINWIKDYIGATDGSLEIDLYGGYKGEISKDFNYDLGVITYQYPSNTAANVVGFANANTTEVYGALTYSVVTAKYSRSVSNFIANNSSSGSAYFEVAANFDLGNGLTLTPHLGHQTIPNQAINGDYTDYSLTLAKDFGNGLSVSIAALGTDAPDAFYKVGTFDNLGKSGVLVGLKYSF
ncbi:TorF family putative porin [Rhodoferax sp. UBA5149]|uniref:TorF family putative porin n=1 Tax=Rhodoferax sp. UBA5149 TaxID=1947379 RepID=UPI0025D11170|nr:TorF family putative porin [Rhodoferax sp. UBA5149]